MLFRKEFDHWSGRRQIDLSDAFGEWMSGKKVKEVLILTERQETIDLANRMHIPVVGLEMEKENALTGTSYILQGVERESVVLLEQVYRRFYGLPVVIAQTRHLFIREMRKSDTEHLFRLYHCSDVQGEVDRAMLSQTELSEFVESYSRIRYPLYGYGMWILEEKGTGAFVGEAGIEEDSHLDWQRRGNKSICLEAGYAICPEFRRRGYATEALNGILKFAKEKREEFCFEEICCYIRPENLVSIRVAERCGFLKRIDRRYGEKREAEQYYQKL